MFSTGICRWLFLLVSLATWVSLTNSKEMRVVCYYTNWSVYRPGDGKFSPQNINPYLCTHLIYAFGGFTKENTLKPFDKYQDIEKGGYAKFTGLKTYNKNLKTMLAIGGWNEGSTRFSPMVANPERRKEFAKNAIKFLRLNHFDGLDLDWEYPSFRDGGKARDRDNYPFLVKELREEFERESEKTGRPRLLLTMAVPAGIEYINKGFDVPKLQKYLDWMNILSYDFHSAFEPSVNHHAPLYSMEEESEYNFEADLNIDFAIKHYLKQGAEPSKLVLGIPTYGRSYTLYNPDAFEIGSPADGPGSMGDATRENGYLAYYEICDYVKNQDWEVEQPNEKAMGPYAFKDNQWVGYDDEEIVKKKAEYVVENGLGGIMFWSIDNDDFRGNCNGKPYPLIEAGRAALINAYGLTDDNFIEKTSKPLKSRTRTRTKTVNKIDESDSEKSEKFEKPNSRRRNRVRENKEVPKDKEEPPTRRKIRRKNSNNEEETSSYSSLKIVTPSYTTPAPPSTPELDGAFKCEDEGFYPHPKDCKKYFWCLNGAGDSGLIAHQFTCPAGLYFNKAADSCDYTQNVLCKKSAQKTSTSTKKPGSSASSSTTTAASISFSTRKPLPKITAATSRTTLRQTTSTTEAYEDDEYDDEEEDDEDEDDNGRNNSEEDPKVIKELIDLIKKAGGIEELEKQFNIKGNFSSTPEHATTKSPIFSKTLYERVLSKAIKSTPINRNASFRNSRGPQSEKTESDIKSDSHSKTERGKLQYTSISRFRSSTTKKPEEEKEADQALEQNTENKSSRLGSEKYPSYTNIRRARVSSTTNEPDTNRNKILGETDDEEDNENDTDDEETEDGNYVITTKRTYTPQYVNIRRQRPSTTEESSTSNYIELRRGTTTENSTTEENIHTTSKYKILRRGTTTSTTSQPELVVNLSSSSRSKPDETTTASLTYNASNRSTTVGAINATTEENRNEYLPNVITTTGTYVTATDDINLIKNENNETETQSVSSKPNFNNFFQRKRPQLFEPRPFAKSTEATTARPRTTQSTKVSESSYDDKITNLRSRGNSRFNPNRNVNTDKQVIPTKRRVIVTEKHVEENRTYRPSEIADLSSLTAVDFDNIKGLNSRTNFRRRRPLISSSSTEKLDDLKTTQKRRRIFLDDKESTTTSTTTTSSFIPRNRKIIRRFRTSTIAPVLPQDTEEQSSILRNRTIFKPILNAKTNEVDDDSFEDTTTEEEENIKLSESNIRESSDINSFQTEPKLRRKFIKSEIYGKSSVYDKEENVSVDPSSTESTRKIIPSKFAITSDKEINSEQIFGRKRKIIRRLRPIGLNNTASLASQVKLNETQNTEADTVQEDIPVKVFHPRFGGRRVTTDVSSSKGLPKNKTVLLRGPSRNYRLKFTPTPSDTEISTSPKYNFILRQRPNREKTTTENIITTIYEENIVELTTEKVKSPEDITTTDITSTEFISTDNNDVNTKYTENPQTTLNIELTTEEVQISTEETTEDSTTELPITTINHESSSISHRSTLRSIESRPKFNPTLLKELQSTESSINVAKPKLNYRNRFSFSPKNDATTEKYISTKDPKRFNRFRPTEKVLNDDTIDNVESKSVSPINKSLYKFRKQKPQENQKDEKLNDDLDDVVNESSSASPVNKSLYKYGKLKPEENQEDEELDDDFDDVVNESSSALPINKSLYKYGKLKPEETQKDKSDDKINASSSPSPINKSLYKYRTSKPQENEKNEELNDNADDIFNENSSVLPINKSLYNNGKLNPQEKQNDEELDDDSDDVVNESSSALPINKSLYKYGKLKPQEIQKDDSDDKVNASSSPSPINKSLYKYRTPKPQENEKVEELKDDSDDSVNESSSALPINKSLYKYGKPKPDENQKDEELDDVVNESSSVLPINKSLYKYGKLKPGETQKDESDDKINASSSPSPINKSLYKYRTPKPQENKKDEELKDDSDDIENESSSTSPLINKSSIYKYGKPKLQENQQNDDIVNEKPKSRYLINKNTRTTNSFYFTKSSSRIPSFTKPTTEESINEELKDIDTDAVKNRNKSLFKNRKINTNLLSSSTLPSTIALEEPSTNIDDYTTDFPTTQSTFESTEHPTTFVHIFAEKNESIQTTTEGFENFNQTTTNKVERLIEVNRIVNVNTKEDIIKNHHLEHVEDKESSPFYDKIGAINRVTVIKVIDKDGHLVSNNETSYKDSQTTESPIKSSVDMIIQIAKIQEVSPPANLTNISVEIKANREQRKFDFIGGGKLDDSKVRNIGKAEIIDGISHINIITPRPIHLTESSTIALEGLFPTDKPTLFTNKNSINEELLETDNSKYVNVRILHPDEEIRINKEVKEPKVIPIKLLKQDEGDFVMRARVVEVLPKTPFNSIKIVPIKVEAAKKMPPPLPLIRINRQHN